jgi:acyl-CoA reductase-like NAD-dependent aldehyde dehydrogenase
VVGLDGSHLAEAAITPPLLIRDLARRLSSDLSDIPIHALLALFARAADLFASGEPDGLTPREFVRSVALTSGLPLSASRNRTIGLFPEALRVMDRFLDVQSPAGLNVFDSHVYESGGVRLGLVPRGRNVAFIMPGNHPSTHFMWLGALAMKIPVVVRPSSDDIFTPHRLVRSLLQAGLPEDAVTFVPGGHDIVDALVDSCSLAVLFGGQTLAERYSSHSRVKVHGPGRSKVIVPANADFGQIIDLIVHLVTDDAGRGCINVSAVVVEGDAAKLAAAVAVALRQVPVLSPLAEGAMLGATRAAHASAFNSLIENGLVQGARELMPAPDGRFAEVEGMTIMLPVVIEVPTYHHPLFGVELPFPFVVFTSVARGELVKASRHSLAVIVAGEDPDLETELLLEPTIDKVLTGGALSTEFDPLEPHEGFLLDFLYQKKTLRSKSGAVRRTRVNPAGPVPNEAPKVGQ